MERFAGKKWKDVEENYKKELLENAICRDCRVGSPLLNGEGMVAFAETLAVMGSVCDGVIKVDDEAVLYNPCIGNNGEPISQKELDAMFEEYKMGLEDNFEDQIYQFERNCKNSPHVVLLGAGASVATIPNGDKNGKKISAMKGFIDKLGMRPVISSINIQTTSDNLEDIYMEMYERNDCCNA